MKYPGRERVSRGDMEGYLPVFKAIYLLCINLYAEFPFLNWEGWNIYNTLRCDGGEYGNMHSLYSYTRSRETKLCIRNRECASSRSQIASGTFRK